MYSIIVACQTGEEGFGIGKNGKMPWPRLDKDMKKFREVTMGHRVVMGRKTYESIGKPLEGRINVVISRKGPIDGVIVYDSLKTALLECKEKYDKNVKTIVIGGGEIYRQCFEDPELYRNLHLLYMTQLNFEKPYECDTFFPNILKNDEIYEKWVEIIEHGETLYNYPIFHDDGTITMTPPGIPMAGDFSVSRHINREEQNYLDLCKDILDNGEMVDTRPGVKAKSCFSRNLRFDVRNGVIPILTTKLVFLRGSLEEILFFTSGKTDAGILKEKGVRIWDGNTTRDFLDKRGLNHYPEGDIGVSYSFQFRHVGAENEYKGCKEDYTGKGIDQISDVIAALKSDEPNRRIMINLWNVAHLDKMTLPPCLFCYVFCRQGEYVSIQAIMRSADLFLGVPFNVTGTTFLLNMVCHLSGRKPKEVSITMVDCHIYENHFSQVKEQIAREPYPFPTLKIKRTAEEIGNIDGFRYEDFEIYNYNPRPAIKGEMAV